MRYKELIPVLIILVMFGVTAYYYNQLPEQIPIHWDQYGEVDGWSTKAFTFFIPLLMVPIYALLHYVPRIAVYKENIAKIYNWYYGLKIVLVLFFFIMQLATIYAALGTEFDMGLLIAPLIAVMFVYLGYMMKHVKRNYFIGIRTPWTLADERVWDKTHEVGGIAFMFMGLFMMLAFMFPDHFLILFLVPIVFILVFIYAYSYFEYQKLPKKKTRRKKKRR